MTFMTAGRFHCKLNNSMRRRTHNARIPTVVLFTAFLLLFLSGSFASIELGYAYGQKSFLWKVQSSRSTVYLLGSIHFLKEDVYPLNQTIDSAYESSDKLVVEADINDLSTINLQTLAESLPPDPSLGPIVQKLFDERNLKMISKIEGYLSSSGSYFVIVGAGHLLGKRGIVELLKNKGYMVEQL